MESSSSSSSGAPGAKALLRGTVAALALSTSLAFVTPSAQSRRPAVPASSHRGTCPYESCMRVESAGVGKHPIIPRKNTYVSLLATEDKTCQHSHSRSSLRVYRITVAPMRAVAIEPPAVAPPAKAAKPDWEAEFRRKQ